MSESDEKVGLGGIYHNMVHNFCRFVEPRTVGVQSEYGEVEY